MTHLDSRGGNRLANGTAAGGEAPPGAAVEPAPHVAGEMVARWADIEATLAPIIGRGGSGALYKRSLNLTAEDHPWLSEAGEHAGALMDLPALHSALASQQNSVAAVGGAALFQAFHEVLASLVGQRLTDQLLGSAGLSSSPSLVARD